MNIVFASNWFNHHEKFFCDAISSQPGVCFHFIQTERIPEERLRLGYQDMTKQTPYCICSYESEKSYREAMDICNNADALILGSAPYEFITERVKKNKLTFFYAERLFRNGLWHMLYPPTFFTVMKRFIIPGNKSNFYMLCASGYTALDCHKICAFRGKYFKWGHFIDVKKFDSVDALLESKRLKHPRGVSILWAGRLIGLKHPEDTVYTAKKLKDNHLVRNIIMVTAYEQYAVDAFKLFVSGYILKKPTEVRSYMESSDIYLFTSDFNEGWGAVLGEAMASGCAVVTSHGIGATPFLAKHKDNALVYETGNVDSLYRNVKKLMDSEDLRMELARNAIDTMQKQWNANVGAERFYNVVKTLINGESVSEYENGPMSRAALLKNNWFKDDRV